MKHNNVINLTTDTPMKSIIMFALPIYIGQIFQLSYSLIDIRIIGNAIGEASLAAVGSTTALSDLLIEFLNGIACGFGIVIANYAGANKKGKIKRATLISIFIGVTVTLLISILCVISLSWILTELNVPEELRAEAAEYIRIILCGLIVTMLFNIFTAILRAIGDSYTPLFFLIISNIMNIIFDLIAAYPLKMGVSGLAYATVAAQAASAVFCFLYIENKYPEIRITRGFLCSDREMMLKLISQGISMGTMISFVTLGSLILQSGINHLGANIIVAHTAARKITLMFLIPFFALGTALATYCSQNQGAKEYGRIKKGIKETILVAFGWCIIVTAVIYICSPNMVRVLTASNENDVINMAVLYLKVNSILFFLAALICILRNSIQGLGDTKTPLVSSFIELTGKVGFTFLIVPLIGYMGVIISEPIIWAVMVIPLLFGIKKAINNNNVT